MSPQSRRPASRRPASRRPAPRRLPARVYWVRRLLVVGVVVAVVWVVTSLVGGNGDDARETSATRDTAPSETTTTPPATDSGGPSQPGGHHVAPGRTTRPQVVTAPLQGADGGCPAEDVIVAPSVASSQRSGADVRLALSVSTTGDTACRLELGPDVLALKVSTAGQPVWDTEQCPGAVPERTAVLRPGWTTAVSVTWPGVYGDKDCTGTTRNAPPGSYALEAAVYEGEPGRADFDLRPPVAPPPDDEAGPGQPDGDPGSGQPAENPSGDAAGGQDETGDGQDGGQT